MHRHAEQEQKAEQKQLIMSANDALSLALREKLGEGAAAEIQEELDDDGPAMPMSNAPLQLETPSSTSMQQQVNDRGLMVPATPPRDYEVIDNPRMSPATRRLGEASEESLKKQRAKEPKRQRINQLNLEYEQRLSAARVAYKEYFTIDDYSTDLDVDGDTEDDFGAGKEGICLSRIPMALWSDASTNHPTGEREKWVETWPARLRFSVFPVHWCMYQQQVSQGM